ncbi:MAG: transposase domain-containing protein [Bryobacteraceae bacterium]
MVPILACIRQRPAGPWVVYYVIAMALYMRSSYREVLRCLLEGVQWLTDPSAGAGESSWKVRHFASTEPAGGGSHEGTTR